MTAESGGCGCSKRTAWVCVFLGILVLAFTAHLMAVLTPSWQYVYLEDGRTEHHHGLWLDCKRDYSNEYGRPREYYESLYRINHLQNPFDQFWLPYLQCVYKFDYWIDDEDWYEHGYDENRLQGDAYQHLFIGWKIAAFTAHAFALVCSFNAIVMLFCGFCHRLLICVAAVLVTLSTISTVIGNGVFYMFASYQDNNIIREDDGIYEQYFGWSFYASLVANLMLLIVSVIGCTATSVILSAERTRIVKIEMDETGDGARLLRMKAVGGFNKNRSYIDNQPLTSIEDSNDPVSRFRRSKSAVYKIDSNALRKWEKDAMRGIALSSSVPDFKRANSLPNVSKKKDKTSEGSRQSLPRGLSNSNLSNTLLSDVSSSPVATLTTREFIPSRELSNAKDVPSRILNNHSKRTENELIYECVDENSMPFEDNNSSMFASKNGTFDRNQWLNSAANRNEMPSEKKAATTMNTYDRVPVGALDLDNDEYLKPRSVSSGNSESGASFSGGVFCGPETTFVAKPNILSIRRQQESEKNNQKKLFCNELQQKQQQRQQRSDYFGRNKSTFEHQVFEREERLRCSTNFGVKNPAEDRKEKKTDYIPSTSQELNAQKTYHRNYPLPTAPYLTLKNDENRDHGKEHVADKEEADRMQDSTIPYFQINTFQTESLNGTPAAIKNGPLTVGNSASNNRSLVNLVNVSSEQASTVSVFDRRDSIDFSAELDAALRSPQPLSLTSITPTRRSADSTALATESINNWRSPSRAASVAQPKHQYFGSFSANAPSAMNDDVEQLNVKETNFNASNITTPTTAYYYPLGSADGLSLAESEMDRSMGSTTFTFNLGGNQQPMGSSPGSHTSSKMTSPWKQKTAFHHSKGIGSAINNKRTMI